MRKTHMPAISMAARFAARPDAVMCNPRNDAGNAEALLQSVQNQLNELNGSIKATAENALKVAEHGVGGFAGVDRFLDVANGAVDQPRGFARRERGSRHRGEGGKSGECRPAGKVIRRR